MNGRDSFARKIRSFVRREGRITPAQQRALEDLWPRFGLEPYEQLDFEDIFGRSAPTTLEIGFGNGESLAHMAAASAEQNYIGIEVHRPGVGHLLQELYRRSINNVRVICADAVEILESSVPDHSLHRIQLFFPDPWPKKRHHKRRIMTPSFASLVARKLQLGGTCHLATDWQSYAENMLEILDYHDDFRNRAGNGCFMERPQFRPETKFELRGKNLGHQVWDLIYERV